MCPPETEETNELITTTGLLPPLDYYVGFPHLDNLLSRDLGDSSEDGGKFSLSASPVSQPVEVSCEGGWEEGRGEEGEGS